MRPEWTPVTRVSELGGYSLTWSADSRWLRWSLGDTLYAAAVAEGYAPGTPLPSTKTTVGLAVPVDVPNGALRIHERSNHHDER